MKPRHRRPMFRVLRALLRGLGWRRGWGDGPCVVPLHRERSGFLDVAALREEPTQRGEINQRRQETNPGDESSQSDIRERAFEDERARYAVRPEGNNLRRFTARGDQPRLTQVLLDAARSLPGSLGLVLVEVHGRPREWTAVDMDRSRLLEGLFELRDLLGEGGIDMAVFSAEESVEVFLDRFATLEIRCGGWHEPRFRGLLEAQGFERLERLSSLPLSYKGAPPWPEEAARRVEEVCARLGLEAVSESPEAHDAG